MYIQTNIVSHCPNCNSLISEWNRKVYCSGSVLCYKCIVFCICGNPIYDNYNTDWIKEAGAWCDGCDRLICSECLASCVECDCYLCEGCLVVSENTNEIYCTNCWENSLE